MNRQLEDTLVEALDLLEQGMPLTRILARYPDMAEELRPYLMTAVNLERLAAPSPSAAQEASRRDFLAYASALQERPQKSPALRLRQILVSGLAVMLLLILSAAALAAASTNAIPGDTLYGSKILLENVRLNYSANPTAAQGMLEEFRQERIDEVLALLSLGRTQTVTFSGTVEEIKDGVWVVEGIPVTITPSTIIGNEVGVGSFIQVTGSTAAGLLTAAKIEVYTGPLPDPDLVDPLPAVKPSVTPAPTVEPVNTPERPDTLLPDNGPETNTPMPLPTATITNADDQTGDGGGDESGPQDLENDLADENEDGGGSAESSDQDISRPEDGDPAEGSDEKSSPGEKSSEESTAEPGDEGGED
ncbi:MAG: DUF5666 domain-containing protein [Candidatus Promineifilaceae bacterium]